MKHKKIILRIVLFAFLFILLFIFLFELVGIPLIEGVPIETIMAPKVNIKKWNTVLWEKRKIIIDEEYLKYVSSDITW